MDKNKKIIKYITLSLYILLVAIFYFFTLRNGNESTKDSSIVTDIFLSVLKFFTFGKVEFDYESIHHITRKLVGHYGYNLLIGIVSLIMIYNFRGIGKISLLICLFLGLFVGISGELLQYIPASRGPSFVDAMINFGGEVSGILISLFILFIKNKKKKEISID